MSDVGQGDKHEMELVVNSKLVRARQWPEVYDLCHTLLHVARVKQHTAMRETHEFRVLFSHGRVLFDSRRNAYDSRMAVCCLTRETCKNVRQNLIPRATA